MVDPDVFESPLFRQIYMNLSTEERRALVVALRSDAGARKIASVFGNHGITIGRTSILNARSDLRFHDELKGIDQGGME